MRDAPEPLDAEEVDVIVVDEEEIIRAAAAGALGRFGFLQERVHDVDGPDELLKRVQDLHSDSSLVWWSGRQSAPPIIILIDQHSLDAVDFGAFHELLSLHPQAHRREPFFVSMSSRLERRRSPDDKFHCFVPKTFASHKLQYCWRVCKAWWMLGCTDPCDLAVPRPVSEEILAAAAAPPPRPMKREGSPSGPSQHHAALVATAVPMSTGERSAPAEGFSASRGLGRSVTGLAPPPSFLEDIETTCMVGRGSYGRVFRARWHSTTVALKVVECFDEVIPESMLFEGQLACSLAHPHLVQTFMYNVRDVTGLGSSLRGYELWIIQEWCGLGTLWQRISSHEILGKGGFSEVTDVCTEIAAGAHYLHCRDIIHGDLTASNVLLVERNCPKGYVCKVSDFGLARVLDQGKTQISTASMGTVAYMPPETFQHSSLTKKVDVYSFGILLWQLCTERMPYEGMQPTQVVVLVSQGAILELPGHVPYRLARLYKLALSRQPESRPSFEKVIQDLLKIVRAEEAFQRICETGSGSSRGPSRSTSPP